MKRSALCLAAVAILHGSATLCFADPITTLFNTGVNGSGTALANGSPDTHYTLHSAPTGAASSLLARTSGFPFPYWFNGGSSSDWISPNNSSNPLNDPAGNYDFRTTFTLPANANLSTASITGNWAGDNDLVKILINGIDIGATAHNDPGSGSHRPLNTFFPFSITSGFVTGTNTIDFIVHNDSGSSGNPTGLRVEMSGTFTPIVPEPTSFVLFAVSGLGLLGYLSRRRKLAAV